MKITKEDIKSICCNHKYHDSVINSDEETQKKEFYKLYGIYRHYRLFFYRFQAELFEECVFPLPKKGGTKKDLENILDHADWILKEGENYLSKDFEIPDEYEKTNFSSGEGGDFALLWDDQFYWKRGHMHSSLIQRSEYTIRRLNASLKRIRNRFFHGIVKEKDKCFWEEEIFDSITDDSDYENICSVVQEFLFDWCIGLHQDITSEYLQMEDANVRFLRLD